MLILLLALQSVDCIATGLCRLPPEPVGPPPGAMFLALGLVAVGVVGLRLRR